MNSTSDAAAVPSGTVYLSAADRQSEAFIVESRRKEAFESSLMNNLLFERAVAVPDIFLFICRGLKQHMDDASSNRLPSLFATAVELGLAYTPFRDVTCETFKDAFTNLKDSKIQGLLPDEDCYRIAARLDRAATRGQAEGAHQKSYWPSHNLGLKFQERLTKFFDPDDSVSTDPPPDASPYVAELWIKTRAWRKDVFVQTRERGEGQFRRGHYLTELGRSVGVNSEVHDASILFDAAHRQGRRQEMMALCQWLNECYQYSQAMEFKAIPNFSNFNPELSPSTLNRLAALDSPSDKQRSWESTTVQASIPPRSVLLDLDPASLLGVRNESAAEEYFDAVEAWREQPSDGNMRAAQEQFKLYAQAISAKAAANGRYERGLIEQVLSQVSGPRRALSATAVATAGASFEGLVGNTAPFLLLGGAAYATYLWVTERNRLHRHSIKAFREVNISD